MKGPGLFSDIGKKAKDLLTQGYIYDQKVPISTCTSTVVALTSDTIKKGGLAFDVSTQYCYKNTIVDTKISTDSNITTSYTLLDVFPYTKSITTFKLPDYNFGKQEFQYLHDNVALFYVVAFKQPQVIDLSALFSANGIVLGVEFGIDIFEDNFTKLNAGVCYKRSNYDISVILDKKGGTSRASCIYHFDENQRTSLAAEINIRHLTNENTVTVGGSYELGLLNTVKARLNNSWKLGAFMQHRLNSKSTLNLSGECDIKALNRTPKFGLSFASKP